MKRHKIALLPAVLAFILLFSACSTGGQKDGSGPASPSGTNAESAYRKITAEDAKARMDQADGSIVLDVRRPDEYEAGHIPGALNLPNEDIADTQPSLLPELNAPVIVYCRTGVRSKQAADKLVAMGYKNVSDMGGIADWDYDTVTGTEPGEYPASGEGAGASSEKAGILSGFSTTDLDGNAVDASILADYDLTMVNVWATFCTPCLSEMPELGELSKEYADQGVQIIGLVADTLNSDGSLSDSQIETAQEIVTATKADYLHLLPSEDLYGILSQATSVPTTFFVDSEGRQVGYAYLGAQSKDKWASIIEETLTKARE